MEGFEEGNEWKNQLSLGLRGKKQEPLKIEMEFTDEAFEEEISYSVLIPLDEWIKTTVNGETYT